jgi:hypothetical protein
MSKISYLNIDPLEIACVCICLTRENLGIKNKWHKFMNDYYNINFYDFESTYEKIKDIISDNYKKVELKIFNNNNYHININKINNNNIHNTNINNNIHNYIHSNINNNIIKKGSFRDNSNLKKFISGKFISSNSMKKIKRNFSLELNKNSTSTLNTYIKSNINEFKNNKRINHINKSNSNESNNKGDTNISSTCTPETISKKSIPKIKGFKIKKFKEQNSSLIIDSIQKVSSRNKLNKLYEVRNNSYRKIRKNNSLSTKNFNGSYAEEKTERFIMNNYNYYMRNYNSSAKKNKNTYVTKR